MDSEIVLLVQEQCLLGKISYNYAMIGKLIARRLNATTLALTTSRQKMCSLRHHSEPLRLKKQAYPILPHKIHTRTQKENLTAQIHLTQEYFRVHMLIPDPIKDIEVHSYMLGNRKKILYILYT